MRVTPSSKSSRSPASTFSRIGASVSRVSRTAMRRLPFPVDDCASQGLELVTVQLAVEARPGLPSVVERYPASFVEGAGRRDAQERSVHGSAGERRANDGVLLCGEEERQGRRPVSEIGAGDLPGLDRGAGAVEDVIGDLEGDAQREAVRAGAAAEPTRRLEQLPRLERAALEICLDGRGRVARLRPLQRLAPRETERRVREDLDRGGIPRRAQLREGAGEEVVAGRASGGRAVDRPGGGLAAAEVGAVDEVVVDERRHVDELDCNACSQRRLCAGRRREEDERGTQPLATCGERLVADRCNQAGMRRDRAREPLLERIEIAVEPRRGPDVRERRTRHEAASPTWSATIPPAKRRNSTPSKPHAPSSAASSSGPGKWRTLAGRYVYAAPPGRTRPSSGTMRSNQSL